MADWLVVVQHDRDVRFGVLRRRPEAESSARGMLLPQQHLQIADEEDAENEFGNVKTLDANTSTSMDGYVKVSYVQWIHLPTGVRYGRLNDISWFERDWTIDSKIRSIRVSVGGPSEADIATDDKLGIDESKALPLYSEKDTRMFLWKLDNRIRQRWGISLASISTSHWLTQLGCGNLSE